MDIARLITVAFRTLSNLLLTPIMTEEMRPTRPTLKTIAAETGLAITTVSRALSDAPDIGANTKMLVRAVAERVGYRPNRAGVRLRTGRSNVISILMAPERELTGHTARLIHTFAAELRNTGFHLIVTPTFEDEDSLEQLRYLRDTGSADAVVLNRVMPNDPRVAYLHENSIPFVTHGRSNMGIAHGWYDFDNQRFAEIVTETFADRGHRDILVVAPPMEQNYAQHIMAGVGSVAAARGLRCEALQGATTDSVMTEIEAALARRLSQDAPDAIIAASVASTVATVTAVEEAGLIVGRDIDIATKEPFPFLRRYRKSIVAVPEDADGAGAFLARAALAAIRHPDKPAMTYLECPGMPKSG